MSPSSDPNKLTETEERIAVGFGIITSLLFGGLLATLSFGLVLLFSESLFKALGSALVVAPLTSLFTVRWFVRGAWRAYIQTKKETQ